MDSMQPLARMLRTLGAIAALGFAPAAAHAQDLPQGYTHDMPDAAGETDASQGPVVQPAQDLAGDEYADTDPSALTDFREPLEPYGTWVDDPTYGTVWVPAASVVGADFAPYQTAGHWALTDEDEWLWVSDYEWGYIPFHYGRWIWTSGHGWVWIPGRVYSPAWVVWRTGDYGYIGWAPMPPTFYWSSGVAVGFWATPSAAYVFCPTTYVFHRHVTTYVVRDRTVVHRVAAHTRPYRPAAAGPRYSAPSRHGASPSRGSSFRPGGYRPASPSLAEARIPSSAAPKGHYKPDARAIGFARRSTTPQARALVAERGRVRTQMERRDAFGRLPQDRPSARAPQVGRRDALRPPQRGAPGHAYRGPQRIDGNAHRGPQRIDGGPPGRGSLRAPSPRSPGVSAPARLPRPQAPVMRTPGVQRPGGALRAPRPMPAPRSPSVRPMPAPRSPSVSRPSFRAPKAAPAPRLAPPRASVAPRAPRSVSKPSSSSKPSGGSKRLRLR